MSTVTEISIYLIQAIANLYLLIVLIRLMLQLAKANFYNPLSQFVVKATALPLTPLQKLFPPIKNFNSGCLVLALLVQLVAIQASALVHSGTLIPIIMSLSWAVVGIASLILSIYFYGLFIVIILSWVAPQSHHPAIALLWQLMEPVMAPFRRLIPPMGGLDLSPIVLFLLINVLRIFVRNVAGATQVIPLFVPGIM